MKPVTTKDPDAGRSPARSTLPRDDGRLQRPIRVLRIIARLNIGGPAYHVSLLSGRMDRGRYSTLLVHGDLGPGEASFAGLARDEGCETVLVPTLSPVVKPGADVRTLRELIRIIRRTQPDIVDTHTAKAGALGRLAVVLARPRPRPLVIHTYHGHVLEGHFGPGKTAAYRMIERRLARVSDCLIGVSQATVDDLVRLGIAPPESFRVVPLGLDLGRFARVTDADGVEFRMRAGAASEDILLTCVCRVTPRKRVDLPIRAVARLREPRTPTCVWPSSATASTARPSSASRASSACQSV